MLTAHLPRPDGLRAAGKDLVSAEFSAADHGFFCDERASHHANSAAQARLLTPAFLKTRARRRQEAAASH